MRTAATLYCDVTVKHTGYPGDRGSRAVQSISNTPAFYSASHKAVACGVSVFPVPGAGGGKKVPGVSCEVISVTRHTHTPNTSLTRETFQNHNSVNAKTQLYPETLDTLVSHTHFVPFAFGLSNTGTLRPKRETGVYSGPAAPRQ